MFYNTVVYVKVSDKQFRPWSAAVFYGVWSEFTYISVRIPDGNEDLHKTDMCMRMMFFDVHWSQLGYGVVFVFHS